MTNPTERDEQLARELFDALDCGGFRWEKSLSAEGKASMTARVKKILNPLLAQVRLRETLEKLTYVLRIEPPLTHDGDMLVQPAIAYAQGALVPLLTKEQVEAIVPVVAQLLAQVRLEEAEPLRDALSQLVESCVTDADICSICLQDLTKHASGCPIVAAEAALRRAAGEKT